MRLHIQIKLIFTRKVLHLASFEAEAHFSPKYRAKFKDDVLRIKPNVRTRIPNSLYEMRLQAIMAAVFMILG